MRLFGVLLVVAVMWRREADDEAGEGRVVVVGLEREDAR